MIFLSCLVSICQKNKKLHMKNIFFCLALLLAANSYAQQNALPDTGLRLEDVEYPFPVHYIRLQIQGEPLQMAYMDVPAEKANGKTVLLLHGKNFNGAYWERTARDLAKNGYRVVIPDQIGFGKSSKPFSIQYTFQLLAQNTKTVLDSIGIQKVCVLGHSMGGMLATRFALMYPDRVEKLVLENPLGLEDWKLKVPYQTVDDWLAGELKQDFAKIKAYQMANYYDNKWTPEYEKWARMQAALTTKKNYPIVAFNSALTYDMIFTQPVFYEFEHIQMPTLLLIGQRDRTAVGKDKAPEEVKSTLGNYPALGKRTAEKIKNSQLVEIEGVGHLPHVEAYEKFIGPLLEFLKK